jgi:hypothetical protein
VKDSEGTFSESAEGVVQFLRQAREAGERLSLPGVRADILRSLHKSGRPAKPARKLSQDRPGAFLSIAELAERWRCSRGTVYNRLRSLGIEVLDFAARGKKGKKAVPFKVIEQIEARSARRLR